MTEKVAKALRLIDLFADLPADCLAQLQRFSMLRKVRPEETLFCQGEPSPYCYGILSGRITIQRVPKEKEFPAKILSVLGPGALFGEQALFKDTPRTAMAMASQDGELVAIQGGPFRDWLEKEPAVGTPLLMGILQNTLSRLRQTSHELSLVYGVGRELDASKPILESIQSACDFLRASLENIETLFMYRRNPYWDEFEPLVSASQPPPPVLPQGHPLIQQASRTLTPVVSRDAQETQNKPAVVLIPCIDPDNPRTPLIGFVWATSQNPSAFSPNILSLLSAVSVQLTEALLRQQRLDELQAKSRLRQDS